jgi:hypothetical protein
MSLAAGPDHLFASVTGKHGVVSGQGASTHKQSTARRHRSRSASDTLPQHHFLPYRTDRKFRTKRLRQQPTGGIVESLRQGVLPVPSVTAPGITLLGGCRNA